MSSFSLNGTIKCVRTTAKALLCEDEGGKTFWVPLSQLQSQSEVHGEGDEGVLVVSRWFAEQRGWTQGHEDTPNLGVKAAAPPMLEPEPSAEAEAAPAARVEDLPDLLRPAPARKGKRKARRLDVIATAPVWRTEHLEKPRVWLKGEAEGSLAVAKQRFEEFGPQTEIAALESSEVAALYMERWNNASMRYRAQAYFRRFPETSALALVLAALARASKAQRAAVALLASMPTGVAHDAAARYGQEVAEALEAELETTDVEPLHVELPAKAAFYEALPAPVLAVGPAAGMSLPPAAVRKLAAILANGEAEPTRQVLELLTPASVRALGWALYERFRAEPDTSDRWMLYQLGATADDAMLRRLVVHVQDGASGLGTWNVRALKVFRLHGSQTALLQLASLAGGRGALAEAASKELERYAHDHELLREELDDRLAPTLGLEAVVELGYGARTFGLSFDHTLAPQVRDGEGALRADLPRQAAGDDPQKVAAARARFQQITTDVRAIARGQLGRLEKALVDQRVWSREGFGAYLARHPLLTHIAQRLVWTDVKSGTTFRVAEDHSLATVDDERYELGGAVRMLHPAIASSKECEAWSLVFADYELLQPFPQLERPVHALTSEERATGTFRRLEGKEAPVRSVLALRDRGWAPGEFDRENGSGYYDLSRAFGRGGRLVLHLGTGIAPGISGYVNTVRLKHVDVKLPEEPDPVAESEVLGELRGLLDEA